MHTSAVIVVAMLTAGCRLDPLVDDDAGISAYILPPGAAVPSVIANNDLAEQIRVNDGVANEVTLGTGFSAGQPVRFWSFGLANQVPSPMYEFVGPNNQPLDPPHPPLVETVPGDTGYNGLHVRFRVEMTEAYGGERITTVAALADAEKLGLILTPESTFTFVASPVVLPGTTLKLSDAVTVTAEDAYARGHIVGMFRFGGAAGRQPNFGLLPTRQVSFLREADEVAYNTTRPIFQAERPAAPPQVGEVENYSALSVVLNVDLVPGRPATSIVSDADLFIRQPTVVKTTSAVARVEVTTTLLLLPMQFKAGEL